MNRWVVILLPTLGSGPFLAVDSVTAESDEPVVFVVIDSDQHGYVSRVEERPVSAVENQFDVADTNQGGLQEVYVGLGNTRTSR